MIGKHFILSGLILFFTASGILLLHEQTPATPARLLQINPDFTIFYLHDPSSALSHLKIAIPGGQTADPSGKEGLSFLTSRLMLEIQNQDDLKKLMTDGSVLSWDGFADFSLISLKCLSENFEDSLKIFLNNFSDPLLSSIRVNNVRRSLEFRVDAELDDPVSHMLVATREMLFPGTAYAGSVSGSKSSLKAIKSRDIKNHYEAYFHSNNLVLALSTNLDEESVTELFRKYQNKFFKGSRPALTTVNPGPISRHHHFFEKDAQQTLVALGFRLPVISPAQYARALLIEDMLGKGIGSRLWTMRSEKALTYSVNARLDYFRGGGILTVFFTTQPENITAGLAALSDIITPLSSEGVGGSELDTAKKHSLTDYLSRHETKEQKAFRLVYYEALGLGHDFMNRLPAAIMAVTLEDINPFIKQLFSPGNRVRIVIGPIDIAPSPPF